MSRILLGLIAFTLCVSSPLVDDAIAQDTSEQPLDQGSDGAKIRTKKTKRKNRAPTSSESPETEPLEKNSDLEKLALYQYVQIDSLYLIPDAQINEKNLKTTLLYQTKKTQVTEPFQGQRSYTQTVYSLGMKFSQIITKNLIASIGVSQVKSEQRESGLTVFTYSKWLIPLTVVYKVTDMVDTGVNILHHRDTVKVGKGELSSSYETFEILLGLHSKSFEMSLSHRPAIKNKSLFASSNYSSMRISGRYKIAASFSIAVGQDQSSSVNQKDTSFLLGLGFKAKSAQALLALKQEKTIYHSTTRDPVNSFLAEGAYLNAKNLPQLGIKLEFIPGRKIKNKDSSSEYHEGNALGIALGPNFYF